MYDLSKAGSLGLRGVLLAASIAWLQACSALPSATTQVVRVTTSPPTNAHCMLQNERGAWSSYSTPESVVILRGAKPLEISCKDNFGHHGSITTGSGLDILAGAFSTGREDTVTRSTAYPPSYQYQGNETNTLNGTIASYPGEVVVPMVSDVAEGTGPVEVYAAGSQVSTVRQEPARARRVVTRHRLARKADCNCHHS